MKAKSVYTMTTTVKAYAAFEAGGELEPYEYELGPLGPHDVDIEVKYCGICHSDKSMIDNEWGFSAYPLVPGHEGCGIVKAVGKEITHVKPGDKAGIGWHSQYCSECNTCTQGDQNLCKSAAPTIMTKGAWGNIVRGKGQAIIKIPESMELRDVGPLMCGGVTVFTPLVENHISPLSKVGVIGIGGLGHLALMFLKYWGCHVTAFTSNLSKTDDLKKMGADDVVNNRKAAEFEAHRGEYDLILSTVNVGLDWNAYLGLLRPKGRLHFLGVQSQPLDISVSRMMGQQLSVSSSLVGSPSTIRKMLEFCDRHDIRPITEHFPVENINEALKHLEEGKARYRIVLDFP